MNLQCSRSFKIFTWEGEPNPFNSLASLIQYQLEIESETRLISIVSKPISIVVVVVVIVVVVFVKKL